MQDVGTTPAVLDYQDPSTRRRRRWMWFHIIALPLVWLPGSLGSLKWYGDEYGATVGANLPALLILMPLSKLGFQPESLLWFVGAAASFVVGMGFLMDRVRAPRWAYALVPPVFAWAVLSGHFVPGHVPPLPPAMTAARRWDMDTLCVAYCSAVYLVALAAIVLTALLRAARRLIRPTANAPA
jgi:hypothetical protein